ncbi:RNA-binding protein 47-like [Daktulosphaira vitifoliae]|uniref:RNA-binding protein 47-like n=1 Tax=Daktulosphaira vitifoliae TaxID=58002 RepID=UPI0021AA9F8A|nr:RNA-binding protein 47-like [Daktulosphaira vitifoliae]
MDMYITQDNFVYCDYFSPDSLYPPSPFTQSYSSALSPYSSISSPYTTLSQTKGSFNQSNVFKFPSPIDDSYIQTREDVIRLTISKAKSISEIEELGQSLINMDKRHVFQNNGQKTLLPISKEEPKRGSELYVALPKSCLEGFLYAIFSQFGEIHQIRLMMHFTGSNRGYGYVMMKNPIQAEMALIKLKDISLPGIRSQLSVNMSTDNRTLFARCIPHDLTEEQLQMEFENRVEGVKKVRVFNDVEDPSKNREFCFIIFKDHRSAALARRSMAENPLFINGTSIMIQWATSEPVFRYSVLRRMSQLHVRNMNVLTTEDDLWKLVVQYVNPNHILLIRKNNTCARIKFSQHEYANLVRRNLDGKELHGVKLIAMWDKIEGSKYEKSGCYQPPSP